MSGKGRGAGCTRSRCCECLLMPWPLLLPPIPVMTRSASMLYFTAHMHLPCRHSGSTTSSCLLSRLPVHAASRRCC